MAARFTIKTTKLNVKIIYVRAEVRHIADDGKMRGARWV